MLIRRPLLLLVVFAAAIFAVAERFTDPGPRERALAQVRPPDSIVFPDQGRLVVAISAASSGEDAFVSTVELVPGQPGSAATHLYQVNRTGTVKEPAGSSLSADSPFVKLYVVEQRPCIASQRQEAPFVGCWDGERWSELPFAGSARGQRITDLWAGGRGSIYAILASQGTPAVQSIWRWQDEKWEATRARIPFDGRTPPAQFAAQPSATGPAVSYGQSSRRGPRTVLAGLRANGVPVVLSVLPGAHGPAAIDPRLVLAPSTKLTRPFSVTAVDRRTGRSRTVTIGQRRPRSQQQGWVSWANGKPIAVWQDGVPVSRRLEFAMRVHVAELSAAGRVERRRHAWSGRSGFIAAGPVLTLAGRPYVTVLQPTSAINRTRPVLKALTSLVTLSQGG